MKHSQTIKELLEVVGGKENIKNFENCATRLRVILKDDSLVDKEKAESIHGAKGYFFNTGQHQFIFGTGKVNEINNELSEELNFEGKEFKEDIYSNMNLGQKLVRTLADILVPLIPALVTTGLLMGIRGLLMELGVEFSSTGLTLFQMLTDTAFAFLPVLIAYSATKKFGGNPIIGIVVGLMMVAPQLPNAWAVAGGNSEPLFINLLGMSIPVVGYQGSVIPAIFAGYLVSKTEKKLRNFVPQIIDLIITPFITITFTIFLMLIVFGPLLNQLEKGVIEFILLVIEAPLGIGYMTFAALQQLLVVTGLHHSLGMIELQLLSETGTNILNPLMSASMAGQFGAAIAATLLMKNKVKRANSISSSSSTLFGITEPLLFGVTLRNIRVFVSGMIGGAAGGLATYILGLKATGMGITFIPGLLLYTSSLASMIQYLIVISISFIVAFILVRAQGKKIAEEIN
ncbi:PTS system sucrose-specific IIC component [Acetoanaerobium pronyense]|uniref:PTS system sucrose-specific IIC component n=1 Tax=Acetoanaerobium pronyense TaxID=1482736 RepID=A0ABS4KMF6_9FIRM|nr:PTS transporter subunit EIIC [Acetoanaerobium pronyense]MBP2028967.1 PTS system sucrose-specific IIC component [Acetoanaerobium pronyense]